MATNPCSACGGAAGATCNCAIVYSDGSAVPGSGTAGDPYVITSPSGTDCTSLAALFPEVDDCTVTGPFSVFATVGGVCQRVILPCPRRYRLV